ncbi:hypothetical protein [Paenibacillus donghaensis]|uniref:GRAM domain-containing protein n=1 Tax=Paenibacillus donghaensis TaxID=414771 RepID=A0A2Z2KHW1_9BACL|nr:hypothetical protein [Paenibacillus donghaensis]ASA25854.1 hypothetical protein B9T62_37090 [Paenibacillus donghaensis]
MLLIAVLRFLSIKRKLKDSPLILSDALSNFYGLASSGPAQIRGNGYLVLTAEALIFEMYVPARKIIIPLSSMIKVDTPRTHLGKLGRAGSRLLRVTYTADNVEEVAAWSVNHPDQWVNALQR